VLEQTLNGLQYGVMLFLMAAGLTLVFGIMNLVNLAHGSLYMVGAYLATAFTEKTGSFVLGVALALPATLLVGVVVGGEHAPGLQRVFTQRTPTSGRKRSAVRDVVER